MTMDFYTRFVLGVVAACLVLLVVQGFQLGAQEPEDDTDRYRMVPIPMARLLLRFDRVTGETWKMALPAAGEWIPVQESLRGAPEPDEPAATPDDRPGATESGQ